MKCNNYNSLMTHGAQSLPHFTTIFGFLCLKSWICCTTTTRFPNVLEVYVRFTVMCWKAASNHRITGQHAFLLCTHTSDHFPTANKKLVPAEGIDAQHCSESCCILIPLTTFCTLPLAAALKNLLMHGRSLTTQDIFLLSGRSINQTQIGIGLSALV